MEVISGYYINRDCLDWFPSIFYLCQVVHIDAEFGLQTFDFCLSSNLVRCF